MAEVTLPSIARPLFDPGRIKILFGGAGGGKTQAAARALVAQATNKPLFIVCLLETQLTAEDSAQRLMMDIIEEFGLEGVFIKSKMSIVGANRSEFVFEQVSRMGRILERADIVWVEDGHNISHKSWTAILTGARKVNSEVWVSMNPGLGNGAAYERFFKESVYRPTFVEMNYRTNEHFPESMDLERHRMLREEPEEYQHVWEGLPRNFEASGENLTVVGDDGTVEEIAPDSPMMVLKRISMDRSESTQSRIEAARSLLPYVHKKQPVAVEGLGQAAGIMGALTPERMAQLSDVDLAKMLAILQGGKVLDAEAFQ